MSRHLRPWLVLLLGSCAPPCSCDCDGTLGTNFTTSTGSGKGSTRAGGAAGASAPTGPGGGAAGRADIAPSDAVLEQWAKPEEGVAERLEQAKERLRIPDGESKSPVKVPAPKGELGDVLERSILAFDAREDLREGTVRFGEATLAVASREYGDGDRTLYLKLTDTAAAPRAHEEVIDALTQHGTQAGTFVRGDIVHGYPGIFSYSPTHASGKAALLVAERYLVELRIQPTSDPEEARKVLEALDWSDLAPAQGPDAKSGVTRRPSR